MTDWEKLVDWLIAAELGGKGKCTQPGDNDRDDDDVDGEDGGMIMTIFVMMMTMIVMKMMMMTELYSNDNIMDKR